MADIFTPEQRSLVMARIKGRGNEQTEGRMIRILRRHHLVGWRRHQPVPGRPDFIFRRTKVAVFVDGCFWHGCPLHGRKPTSNQAYWLPKLERNKQRDFRVTRQLRKAGWKVVRFWQHDIDASEARIVWRLKTALGDASNQLPTMENKR